MLNDDEQLEKLFPDFILAGFPKCGTTSIAKYLEMHPSICFSKPKEPNFFLANGNYSSETWKGYSKCFDHWKSHQICGEGSQRYTQRDRYPNVAQDIYRNLPSTKLIFVARHPIKRFVSHFKYVDRDANLKISINDTLKYQWLVKKCVNTSKYFYQIDPYLKLFPRENIWIGFYEDFVEDKETFFSSLFDFLQINYYLHSEDIKLNTATDPPRSSALYETLNKNSVYNFIKGFIPLNLKHKYRKFLKIRFNQTKKYQMREDFIERLENEFYEDSQYFLQLAGKEPDFWKLNH